MEMDTLITQTEVLSWQDLNLEPATEVAKKSSDLALVDHLKAERPFNKFAIHTIIKTTWNFIQKFIIKDMEASLFLFTFQSPQNKHRVLNQAP